jgi:hypothetical protein
MTPDHQTALNNCLLRGREVALGEAEPPLSTCRDALLQIWETATQTERDRIDSDCDLGSHTSRKS